MAITNKEEGVWSIDQVYAKQNQGSIWEYTNAGSLYITGNDPWQSGTTGQNDRVNRSSPIQIPGKWALEDSIFASANKITAREKNVIAMKSDGTLWGWGDSDKGQRGDNNIAQRSSPTQVSGTTWNVLNLAGTNCRSTFCTKTDGTLWSWGDNNYGQLGQNNTTRYSSPVQLPGTTWKATINDGHKSMGTKTDGTLWTWGRNQYGELGHGDTDNESSPKQVPGTTWGDSFGSYDAAAVVVKTDGTLWAWGLNTVGQLAQNNRTNRDSPVQIPGTTWSKVCQGIQNGVCALKTDGTLWGWGSNAYGSLGQNNRTQYSSPVQIGSDTTWDNITGNFYHMAGHKTDGTLWVWGNNSRGQLGLNQPSNSDKSSPVQIPGTWENTFKAGGYVTVALKN